MPEHASDIESRLHVRAEAPQSTLHLAFSSSQRLEVIDRYDLRDPSWSLVFKDIAQLAAQLLDLPHGAVNIMGSDSVWSAGTNDGIPILKPAEFSMCPYVIEGGAPLLVADAKEDSRFTDIPSVIAGDVRNYCGVPLFSPEGGPVGSVCAWGSRVREPSQKDLEGLWALSRQASSLLELRYLSRKLDREKRNQQLSSQILSDIVAGKTLKEVLNALALSIEEQIGEVGAHCSILLVEDGRLYHCVAPTLPSSFTEAIDGLAIGSSVGSCGRAAANGIASVTFDIALDPDWQAFREAALALDLRSCSSLPIFDTYQNVIATFALYYATPRQPKPEHWVILEEWAALVGLSILRSNEQAKLRQSASSDPLTGLANRTTLLSQIQAAISRPEDTQDVAVLLCDLDGFKLLNDSLGHANGDNFLIQLARRLTDALQDEARIGRLGGDEFVAVIEGPLSLEKANRIAENILDLIRVPTLIAGRSVTLTGSIGIAIGDLRSTPEDLLGRADAAMYVAKATGRNRASVADAQLLQKTINRFDTEVDLRAAISGGQMDLAFQPSIDMENGQVLGVEALLRWHHPVRGEISPDSFIPIAEETELIFELGAWVLQEACSKFADRRFLDRKFKDVRLWVNVSSKQLTDEFFAVVAKVLESTGVPANRLGLEITESIFMHDVDTIATILTRLRLNGVSIAIDDFGTGFSSLAQLRKLPVDVIKIDKAFIDGIGVTGADESVVVAIMKLAEALGIHIVAEGVETPSQRDRLLELGCTHAQGYLFARPMGIDSIDCTIKI